MTWFDWFFVGSLLLLILISMFCWGYTIYDLFRKKD